MNVGIVCYPTVGGSGAVATALGRQLARRGHSVHLVSHRLPFRLGDFDEDVTFHAVDVSSFGLFEHPPQDLALAAKMAEVARDHSLDLFHVHYAIPNAMACGLPVIGTDAGGLPEVVKHTETGFLLPVGDVEGMAARSLEILKDEERRHEMGQAGRRRAACLFGADRVVTQYEDLYEKVLEVSP